MCIRILSQARYNTHTDPLFKSLHILKFNEIIELELLKLGHMIRKKELPIEMLNTFNIRQRHKYNTRNAN